MNISRTLPSIILLSLCGAACSKTEAKQAPPTPTVKAVEPAVAPAPAPAPVQEGPGPTTVEPAQKRALTARETEALGLIRSIADGKTVQLDRVDSDEDDRVFVFVDLSTKPQGGQNRIQESYCPFSASGDGVEKMAKLLKQLAPQMQQAFTDERVSCTEKNTKRVTCTVPATMEGEASIDFEITSNPTSIAALALYETFMIDDEARLAKDQKTISSANANLSKEEFLSNAEWSEKHDVPRKDALE
jgi:hypothetical protein